jgi:hypothetical protein
MAVLNLTTRVLRFARSDVLTALAMGYNDMRSVESESTFRGNMSPPSSGLKNTPSKIQLENR